MSASPSPGPSSAPKSGTTTTSAPRHAQTAVEKQRLQLEKLLKDPQKPAYVPAAPKEKTIRAPREMMKNVQGSSAGAGSGEFHVYKASRRREFERLKLMDEQTKKEIEEREFEQKKREWEEQAEAKTAKNRAKRQKKKQRSHGGKGDEKGGSGAGGSTDAPLKKRRLVNGEALVFKRPGEGSDEEDDGDEDVGPSPSDPAGPSTTGDPAQTAVPIVDAPRITIIEDD